MTSMKMVSNNLGDSVSPTTPTLALHNSFATRIFSRIPEDITIIVDGESFLLHKFPLVAMSGKIRRMIGKEANTSTLDLVDFPGGAPTFELAMKFCYGINFPITTTNVAQLYCAAEYLEMTEEHRDDNLVAQTGVFLNDVVLQSLGSSVEVLSTCKSLGCVAEEAGIAESCVEAIASIAVKEQMVSGMSQSEYEGGRSVSSNIECTCDDWRIDDLLRLPIDLFTRVVHAMENAGLRSSSIVESVIRYAQSSLKDIGRSQSGNMPEIEQRMLLETLVSLLPLAEKCSWIPIGFLFWMLKTSIALGSGISCRIELEKRIASHLAMATLDDLLIPSVPASDSLFDVDCMHRILVNFLQQTRDDEHDMRGNDHNTLDSPFRGSLHKVGCLVDAYLAEIAADPYLSFNKFCALIELVVPGCFRVIDDSLYRAIDVYLKAHPMLTDNECKKLCKFIDCERLSQEACNHVVRNDRLPVKMTVHVLYAEQVRLRNSLSESSREGFVSQKLSSRTPSGPTSPRDTYASLRQANQELKHEISRMRVRLSDLEKEQLLLKQGIVNKRSSGETFLSSISRGLGMFIGQKGKGNRPKPDGKSRSGRNRVRLNLEAFFGGRGRNVPALVTSRVRTSGHQLTI